MTVTVMWKTVSDACNLACDYCYYSRCGGAPSHVERIDHRVLEKFIKEYMQYVHQTDGQAVFAWQGGEPLLAGLDFFHEIVRLQAMYAQPNTIISNSVQTNGTLITDEWARFFKRYNFLVGVSIDGPERLHDMRRTNHSGIGSFSRVMKGVQHLNRYQVDYNVLTVLHAKNIQHTDELIEFYKQNDFRWIQFIPAMEFKAQDISRAPTYEISPDEYGQFLCDVFDMWLEDGDLQFSMRLFDSVLLMYMGRNPGYCILMERCGQSLVLELNGDAYPCDFHIHSDWKLGNVGKDTLATLLWGERMRKFASMKPSLPNSCANCKWNSICHGGCPRNRSVGETGVVESDYFCESYKRFYEYSSEKMKELATRLRRQLFEQGAGNRKFFGSNELCPCGSGKRYKHCCHTLYETEWTFR